MVRRGADVRPGARAVLAAAGPESGRKERSGAEGRVGAPGAQGPAVRRASSVLRPPRGPNTPPLSVSLCASPGSGRTVASSMLGLVCQKTHGSSRERVMHALKERIQSKLQRTALQVLARLGSRRTLADPVKGSEWYSRGESCQEEA